MAHLYAKIKIKVREVCISNVTFVISLDSET